MLLNLVTPLHERTLRNYAERLTLDKPAYMKTAREFERDYWDGDRLCGYGGYSYIPGYWKPVARGLIERYGLQDGDSVLDIGCGKGYLLYEMQLLMPKLKFCGMDRSKYALQHRHPDLDAELRYGKAQFGLPYADDEFSLVISLGTLHNLTLSELTRTIPEINRVGNDAYIMVESFRDEAEWFNLCAWCLTAESLMRPADWQFLFDQCGYKGDHEFIFFR